MLSFSISCNWSIDNVHFVSYSLLYKNIEKIKLFLTFECQEQYSRYEKVSPDPNMSEKRKEPAFLYQNIS